MAQFTTQCPHCKQQFNAQTEWIGQNTNCPTCGKAFTISCNEEAPRACATKNVTTNNKSKGIIFIIVFAIVVLSCLGSGIIKTIYDYSAIEGMRSSMGEFMGVRFSASTKEVIIDSLDSFLGGALFYGYFTQTSNEAMRKKFFYRFGDADTEWWEKLYQQNVDAEKLMKKNANE